MSEHDIQLETVNLLRGGRRGDDRAEPPEALNAWNRQFGADLLAALRQAAGRRRGARRAHHRRRTRASPRAPT